MIGDLSGEVAVVIGGTSGIGRVLAHGLAEAGADVVPTSRRMAHVESTAREIEERGRRTLRVDSDVCDRDSLEKLLKKTVEAFGKVDILVNCAGRIQVAPTLEFSDDDWNAILEINLEGTLRACQVFGRHMIDRRYGRIINIASIGSFRALNHAAAYCASKAGVAALTKSLALEWRQYGVCVNAIMPGVFVTDLNRKLLEGTARGQDWNAILEINLEGTLRACQVFGRHMIDRRYGRIINIASIGSFRALNHAAAYCASKAGVAALTKSSSSENSSVGAT